MRISNLKNALIGPFTAVTRVQIPSGTPNLSVEVGSCLALFVEPETDPRELVEPIQTIEKSVIFIIPRSPNLAEPAFCVGSGLLPA
jgi:hypothetical protein